MQKQKKPPQRCIRCTRRNGILAWHFTRGLLLRDGRPLPQPGELLKEQEALLWRRGLHASTKILDAYGYVSTTTVSRVRVGGRIDEYVRSNKIPPKTEWVRSRDKICGTERVDGEHAKATGPAAGELEAILAAYKKEHPDG